MLMTRLSRSLLVVPARRTAHRRGATFIEVLVSIGLFGLISAFVSVVVLTVARQSRASFDTISADSSSYRVLDRVRRELLTSQFGTVVVAQDGNSVTFTNPARGLRSRIEFDNENRRCFYVPDVTAVNPDRVEWGRDITGSFFPADDIGKRFGVEIQSDGSTARRENLTISYSDIVTVRN